MDLLSQSSGERGAYKARVKSLRPRHFTVESLGATNFNSDSEHPGTARFKRDKRLSGSRSLPPVYPVEARPTSKTGVAAPTSSFNFPPSTSLLEEQQEHHFVRDDVVHGQ
ncbi:uncharacterized protein IUM83_13817 [Phytophthora cinnamomi]|uniref:uncharacterized protein n=1 Tax=Phytophthora cinnamomi TaxID=4785 RepID=UPI003559836D|nr:hypothetical protein IUM83_13817 [Phytophthora cinnamomi]